MKIAFTGASSTGKTTLIKELISDPKFKDFNLVHLPTDARKILNSLGHKSMDLMTAKDTRQFQIHYHREKTNLELRASNFITDRSYVDIASYWQIRDNNGILASSDEMLQECKNSSNIYDHHFYFPTGIIPFEDDGYRSIDLELNNKIGDQILQNLLGWNLQFSTIEIKNIDDRKKLVLDILKEIS